MHLNRLYQAVPSMQGEKGQIAYLLVIGFFLMSLVSVGAILIQTSSRDTSQQLHVSGQADSVARAGLTDAIAWFRRQPTQPVRSSFDPTLYPYADAAFAPVASTDPVKSDTLDASIGLVKEYSINTAGSLWARYEVRRQADLSTNPVDAMAVHDITNRRIPGYSAGDGLVWYIESRGYVYQKRGSGAFNASPNRVVATARIATEIRRLALTLDSNAATFVTSRSNVTLQNNGRIAGGNDFGLAYYGGSGGSGLSNVTGTPALKLLSGSINVQNIFGVTLNELRLMADVSVSQMSDMPSEYPTMAVVYVNGNADFDSAVPLRGGGILVVNGNLTVASTSNTLFSGLILVTGNATINGPALISGSLVVQGNLTLNGSGDVAQVEYDNGVLNSVRQQVAQYRENRSATYTFTALR